MNQEKKYSIFADYGGKSTIKVIIVDLLSQVTHLPWVRLNLGYDTFLAFLTILYFIPSYYLGTNINSVFTLVNFLFATAIVLVVFPAYYMIKVKKEPLSEIGFTSKRLIPSLSISTLLVLRYLPILKTYLGVLPEANVLPHLIYCGLCLWEPFFVYCWIQLRFEKAFGIIPGVLAAGVCMAAYHVGTFPMSMVCLLGFFGLIYGVIFRLTRNILVLWPLTWAGASAMGTLMGGLVFGWVQVKLYGAILVIQLLSIWLFYQSERTILTSNANNMFKSNEKKAHTLEIQDWFRVFIYTPLIFYQFYLSWRYYNNMGLDWVTNLGWLVLTVSAFFGWLPIFTFKKHGGVPEKKSYVHTTKLVTSGVYSIVRHPQFLAGILICLSMMLISQHPHSIFAGAIAAIVYASEVNPADERLIEKFGEPYLEYKKQVPAIDFITGFYRAARK